MDIKTFLALSEEVQYVVIQHCADGIFAIPGMINTQMTSLAIEFSERVDEDLAVATFDGSDYLENAMNGQRLQRYFTSNNISFDVVSNDQLKIKLSVLMNLFIKE